MRTAAFAAALGCIVCIALAVKRPDAGLPPRPVYEWENWYGHWRSGISEVRPSTHRPPPPSVPNPRACVRQPVKLFVYPLEGTVLRTCVGVGWCLGPLRLVVGLDTRWLTPVCPSRPCCPR